MFRRTAHRTSLLAALAASALALLAPAAHAELTAPESLALDAYAPSNSAPVVTSKETLGAGKYYTVIVRGTFTVFNQSTWNNGKPYCGAPDAAPVDPSPGQPITPAGTDPEAIFGAPLPPGGACPQIPRHYNGFQIDVGDGFKDLDPIDGHHEAPAADHVYRYRLRGAGQRVRFIINDSTFTDNNGILSIRLRPAVRSECGDDAECRNATPDDAPPPEDEEKPELKDERPGLIQAPSTRQCLSRRRFAMHILRPRIRPLADVAVTVAGRSVKVRKVTRRVRTGRGSRRERIGFFRAVVDLRGRPKGTYEVRVVTRAKNGELRKAVRRYRTCN